MKRIILIALVFPLNGCGTLDGMKEIVYNDINNEKNNEFRASKKSVQKKCFKS